MIIVRSPLRISLGGGGTDLESYYSKKRGFLIAAAIDQYVYVTILKPFEKGIFLKYSEIENVSKVTDIKHNIIRTALSLPQFESNQIEITALADIPSGTGLGSSSSFTAALLRALYAYNGWAIHQSELAELACRIEIDLLNEPIGKQDQYITAFGGLSKFNFERDGRVTTSSVAVSKTTLSRLSSNLLLYYTGFRRQASEILSVQKLKSLNDDADMIKNLDKVKEIGLESDNLLTRGKLDEFGLLMDTHWRNKMKRSTNMTNDKINEWYEYAVNNGALGGKIVGAGGGGFLLLYANEPEKLREAMKITGLKEIKFNFDFEGTKVIA